jgi:hypothetical protein
MPKIITVGGNVVTTLSGGTTYALSINANNYTNLGGFTLAGTSTQTYTTSTSVASSDFRGFLIVFCLFKVNTTEVARQQIPLYFDSLLSGWSNTVIEVFSGYDKFHITFTVGYNKTTGLFTFNIPSLATTQNSYAVIGATSPIYTSTNIMTISAASSDYTADCSFALAWVSF